MTIRAIISRLPPVLLLFWIGSAHSIEPKDLHEIESVLGWAPEHAVYGQFTHGARARNTFNTRTAVIAFSDGTLFALSHARYRVIADIPCAHIRDVQLDYRGRNGVVMTVVADRIYTFRTWLDDSGRDLIDTVTSSACATLESARD